MIELFDDLDQGTKNTIARVIDTMFELFPLNEVPNCVSTMRNSLARNRQKEFVDFYFNLKLQELEKEIENANTAN